MLGAEIASGPQAYSSQFGSGYDWANIATLDSGVTSSPQITKWSGSPMNVIGEADAIVGEDLCKSGSTSGWTCGKVLAVDQEVDIEDDSQNTIPVDSTVASTCVLPGDSGGPAEVAGYALGITSASSYDSSCSEAQEVSTFFPIQSDQNSSVETAIGSNWELSVVSSVPTITSSLSRGSITQGASITGTLTNADPTRSTVQVYLDGSSTSLTAPVSGTGNGTWSLNPGTLTPGTHTISVRSRWGSWSYSNPTATQSFVVTKAISATRIAGVDRYDGAIQVAKVIAPSGITVNTVFVSSGGDFPDALSAAPAAAHLGGPLLLANPTSVPSNVAQEIQTLQPANIVMVGGTAVLSDGVEAQLRALVPGANVSRLAGSDRYNSSNAIVQASFPAGTTTTAFLATGVNYPDALSATSAATSLSAPVILIPGSASALSPSTVTLLQHLGVTRVVLAGGLASVSASIEAQLQTMYPGQVSRFGGTDRYQTSQLMNAGFFPQASSVYFASGANFPDALAGGVLAAINGAPLLTVEPTCVPQEDFTSLGSWGASSVTLFGGTAALTPAVQSLTSCG
jgi:putative cell wall-binding protein